MMRLSYRDRRHRAGAGRRIRGAIGWLLARLAMAFEGCSGPGWMEMTQDRVKPGHNRVLATVAMNSNCGSRTSLRISWSLRYRKKGARQSVPEHGQVRSSAFCLNRPDVGVSRVSLLRGNWPQRFRIDNACFLTHALIVFIEVCFFSIFPRRALCPSRYGDT
jgi:hypothetical protein